jgi:hypothetical protein
MAKKEDVKNALETMKPEEKALTTEGSEAKTVAEVAKHMREAGYQVAIHRPRDIEKARLKILEHCKRPKFAAKVEYNKPIGKGIKGPSIRFAELALREWGNIISDIQVIYEDEMNRRSKVFITDLETNTTFTKEITIKKTVERKSDKGRDVIGARINSSNEKVFVVRATDDEIHNKEAALLSKALRNEGLRLIPSDITEEALETARETLKRADADDPDAAKRKILDAFAALEIMPDDLEIYLGHKVSRLSKSEIEDLRGIYTAIHEGDAKWEDYLEKPKEEPEPDENQTRIHEKMKEEGLFPASDLQEE